VLSSWHVPMYVAVRRGALKLSRDALSGEPPRVPAGLFTPGRLASSSSSLGLSWSFLSTRLACHAQA
jgi:hypothetical protein